MTELEFNIFEKSKSPDKSTSVEPKLDRPKVVTWGTFDCLHDGHKEFLLQASQLGKLFVIVVPSFAKVFNKEYKPQKSAFERRADLIQFGKDHGIIENVLIDCYQFGLKSLILLKPDIFVFGYDQNSIWEKLLPQFLRCFGLKPQYTRMPKTDVVMHNGNNGNYSLNLGNYQSILEHKRTFYKKSNPFEYHATHLVNLMNSESTMQNHDEIR